LGAVQKAGKLREQLGNHTLRKVCVYVGGVLLLDVLGELLIPGFKGLGELILSFF
jgi:hypothetical protein